MRFFNIKSLFLSFYLLLLIGLSSSSSIFHDFGGNISFSEYVEWVKYEAERDAQIISQIKTQSYCPCVQFTEAGWVEEFKPYIESGAITLQQAKNPCVVHILMESGSQKNTRT